MTTLVIYNPWAGPAPTRLVAERAASQWRAAGWHVDVAATRYPGEARELGRQAAAAGYERVIVAGGDGTLSEAAGGLAGSSTALGLLPLGTANIWAHEVGLKSSGTLGLAGLAELTKAIAASHIRRVDLGWTGSRHFLLWLGVGLDGHIVSRVEPRSRLAKALGLPYYVAAAMAAGRDWGGAVMRVSVDGQSVEDQLLLILVGNSRWYGGGLFRISPNARMDDGLFEVWALRGSSYRDSLATTWNLFRGRHIGHPAVVHMTGREITIAGPAGVPVQVDGDALAGSWPLTISVVPQALRLLVPGGAPTDLFSSAGAGSQSGMI